MFVTSESGLFVHLSCVHRGSSEWICNVILELRNMCNSSGYGQSGSIFECENINLYVNASI